ncbi:MAG TPA: hypothetical protein VK210_01040 [Terriglobia bacterium]|nr:hypothetical protein [Terriglobia bacterium]
MRLQLHQVIGFFGAVIMVLMPASHIVAQNTEYTIKVMPPGGPPPRLSDGHPDLSGHWFPNGAGQATSGRFGVDPAAVSTFDPKVTPEEQPAFQPWALAKIKAMTPTELELSKSSVNCIPRGVPAIWLQNPYTTLMVHTPGMLVQLYEVLNNWRVIHLDGRPLPKYPEPLFHGNSTARWEGDTLVVESIGFDDRTYIMPNGWFHSDDLRVTERYQRPSMNYLVVQITVDDPKVLQKPWKSAPRRWTLGDGNVYEFYCTNNKELEELQKLRELELKQAKEKPASP